MPYPKLHFVIEPLCGWTYAAAPVIKLSQSIPGLSIELHGGGMLAGEKRCPLTPEWKTFVLPLDHRINKVSGQPFSDKYYKLLDDMSVVLDSTPATIAILAAHKTKKEGIIALNKIQTAYFYEGKNISDNDVIKDIIADLDIDSMNFKITYDIYKRSIQEHFKETKRLLQRIDVRGFPSAVLEIDDQYISLAISNFYGSPQQWLTYLNAQLQTHIVATEAIYP